MHNLTLRPFTKTDIFTNRLLALETRSTVSVSYVIGSPRKRGEPDPLHVTLAGRHDTDFYTVAIRVEHDDRGSLFDIEIHIPDTGYCENMKDIVSHLLDHYATMDYLEQRIEKALVKRPVYPETVHLDKIMKDIGVGYKEPIAVFSPDTREYKRLKAAAILLEAETGKSHIVENCLYDMGQNWHWTTILGESGCRRYPYVQVLNPKQQRMLVFGSMKQFNETVEQLIQEKNSRI